MKPLIPLFIFFISFSPAFAQNDNCNCLHDFNTLTEKLEANYVAWYLNKSRMEKEYLSLKSQFRTRAASTSVRECVRLLQSFLDFFKDGHLFVVEYPEYSKEELEVYKNQVKTAGADEASINRHFTNNKDKLADMEGIWTDGNSQFAIMKKRETGKLVAIIINTADKSKIGEMKMELEQDKEDVTTYTGYYYSNAYSKRYTTAHLYKDATLLYLTGGIYWKKTGDPVAPANPSLEMIENKFAVITIPSFLIDKKILDQFLRDNRDALQQASFWIIDIRGNIGGNGIYFDLMSGYYEKPDKATEPGYAVASKDNLEYFSKFAGGSNNPYGPVIKAMQDSMGQLVKGPRFRDLVLSVQKTNLQKVVIITDRSNMSAAETFILSSKAISSKVITMGDFTGGVVDYNNINIVKLSCGSQNIQFGYPMYSRTADAHINGLNKTGVKPDVFIPKEVKDKVGFVVDYLKKS